MKMLLLACLRGNIIIYYGEELGLTQVDIPFDQLHDPEAIANWPLTLSRDGARTPMPWNADAAHGGFTAGEPWLPLGALNQQIAVDSQQADPASLLNYTKSVLGLRNANPALHHGVVTGCNAEESLLDLTRSADAQQVRCLFNMSPDPIPLAGIDGTILFAANAATPDTLPPFGALILEI